MKARAGLLLPNDHDRDERLCRSMQIFVEATAEQSRLIQNDSPATEAEIRTFLGERSVSNYRTCLEASRSRCLWGVYLTAGTDAMSAALAFDPAESIDAYDLENCLTSLWEQVEIQEYPRRVIMALPQIFLHCKTISLCAKLPSLAEFVSEVIRQLQRLAKGRVYMLTVLAQALREAALLSPEVFEVFPYSEYIFEYVKSPPTAKTEFILGALMADRLVKYAPNRTYSEYYGKHEGYGHACFFDLVRMIPITEATSKRLIDLNERILNLWGAQKTIVPVHSPWKATAQLQMLLLSLERTLPDLPSANIKRYMDVLMRILSIEPLPRYRFLLEWIVARLLRFESEWRFHPLKILKNMDLSNPKFMVSMVKIAFLLATLSDADEIYALDVMTQLVVLSASPKIAIRHEAHWTIPQLWDHAMEQGWKSILDNPAFLRLDEAIRASEPFLSPPEGRIQDGFHAEKLHTMTYLFEGKYLMFKPYDPQRISRNDFLEVFEESGMIGIAPTDDTSKRIMPMGEPMAASALEAATTDKTLEEEEDVSKVNGAAVPLQTKSSTWHDIIQLTIAQGVDGQGKGNRDVRDIVVIASSSTTTSTLGVFREFQRYLELPSLWCATPIPSHQRISHRYPYLVTFGCRSRSRRWDRFLKPSPTTKKRATR